MQDFIHQCWHEYEQENSNSSELYQEFVGALTEHVLTKFGHMRRSGNSKTDITRDQIFVCIWLCKCGSYVNEQSIGFSATNKEPISCKGVWELSHITKYLHSSTTTFNFNCCIIIQVPHLLLEMFYCQLSLVMFTIFNFLWWHPFRCQSHSQFCGPCRKIFIRKVFSCEYADYAETNIIFLYPLLQKGTSAILKKATSHQIF